jgi:hypothetical protein
MDCGGLTDDVITGPRGEADCGAGHVFVATSLASLIYAGPDLRFYLRPSRSLGEPDVVVDLQTEPDLRRDPKVLAETKRGIRGNPTLPIYDVTDAIRRNVDVACERVDAELQRLHELFVEYLSGWDRIKKLACHDGFL